MARPIKKEPDYFPLDTDLLSNRKIRQIKRKYGSDAFGLCIYNHRTTKTNQKYPSVNL